MNKELMHLIIDSNIANLETKMIICLYWYNKYKKNYIPNIMLERKFKVTRRQIQVVLKKLIDKNIISTYYVGSKRFFRILYFPTNSNSIDKSTDDIFSYNWLENK